MNTPKDGGSAFPQHVFHDLVDDEVSFIESHGGMTLRDYFAGQAIPWAAQLSVINTLKADDVAVTAYRLADAMIKAREAGK